MHLFTLSYKLRGKFVVVYAIYYVVSEYSAKLDCRKFFLQCIFVFISKSNRDNGNCGYNPNGCVRSCMCACASYAQFIWVLCVLWFGFRVIRICQCPAYPWPWVYASLLTWGVIALNCVHACTYFKGLSLPGWSVLGWCAVFIGPLGAQSCELKGRYQ